MGGHRALHRDEASLPEPRRRHLLPLRLPGDPSGGRLERQHHLQDPLQLGGGDDGRAGRRGRDAGARADALDRRRGRQAHHRDDRRARQVSERHRVGVRRRGVASRSARRGSAVAARYPRRHGPRVRPAVRRREAAPAQAWPAARSRDARLHQRGDLRGMRRLRREEQLPVGASGRDRVRAQDADPSVVLQQGLLVPEG